LAQENAYDKFKDDEVDIIIFGHNHQPAIFTKNKILMLNPGSLTNKRREKWHSFIILDIEKGILDAKIRFEGGK
jgi:putative phosphoesterase